jgi:hypothetical protein
MELTNVRGPDVAEESAKFNEERLRGEGKDGQMVNIPSLYSLRDLLRKLTLQVVSQTRPPPGHS